METKYFMVQEGHEGLKEYLSAEYDMDVYDITPVKNSIRVSTDKGEKCLKRAKYGTGQFLFILSAMKHLLDNGFESVLPFIPTKDGRLYIELENGFGFLTDWVHGKECDYSNPVELKMAVDALSELHRYSEGFEPMEGAEKRTGWGRWIEKFSRRIDEMIEFKRIIWQKGKLSYFDVAYMENVDYFIGQGIDAIDRLSNTRYFELTEREKLKKSFCHHDYAHHNVLISDDLKVYIIDFDYCICDTRLHDLSSLIIRNMRHGNWNMEKAQFIIDCYMNNQSIEKDEIPVMDAFMEFPQDFWQVGLQYYVEKLNWEETHFNKRLERVIEDRMDREIFLDEFLHSIHV